MRINGALEPHNGALVIISERDDEGGGEKANNFVNHTRTKTYANAKLGLFEVNKAIHFQNVINSVQQQQQQQQEEELKDQKQRKRKQNQNHLKKLQIENKAQIKDQQQKITKLHEKSLINFSTGNNEKNKQYNNKSTSYNNKKNYPNHNKKATVKATVKATHNLIDETHFGKIKKIPETIIRTKAITTPTPTPTITNIIKPKTTSIKRGQSGAGIKVKVGTKVEVGIFSSLIVTRLANFMVKIMRNLHVQQSLADARSSHSNGSDGSDGYIDNGSGSAFVDGDKNIRGNGNESNHSHCQQWSASIGRKLGMLNLLLLLMACGVVHGDDGDNFFAVNRFSMESDTTTPEFDYASRGVKKFGDKCENTLECGFPGSICDPKKKSCQCTEDLPVTNHIDKCGKEAAVNESCFFNEQCEVKYFQTECRDGKCVCRFDMTPFWAKDGSVECKGRQEKRGPETYVDPAMIGVLVGMALMFIIICVVLRLFSQARWRENRTIFNTPNPRLMNVSLLRDSKLIHGQERRGSRMSMRGPSRQPSMASLRPHSPNPSLGKTGTRSNSHGSASNASATSLRSNSVAPGNVGSGASHQHERHGSAYYQHQQHHSQQQQPHAKDEHVTNITTNPVAESVTVEIMTPDK